MVKRFEIEPADRDERLGEAVEEFMALAEAGDAPDPELFASRYPELGDDLVEALEGLSLVRGLVGAPGEKGRRLESGRRLAGYRIVRELGSGGMGVVYEAVHVDLDRPVALKVLDARATRESNGLRRFQEEAKMAAGLHHTHIVPVFDVGHVGGLCYYAMQRIEGSGLDHVLRGMRRERTTAAGSGSVRPSASQNSAPVSLTDTASGSLSWPVTAARSPLPPTPEQHDGVVFVPPRGSAYYRWVAEAGRQAAQALAHAHRRGVIHRDIKPSNLLVDARGTIWVTDFGLARRLADPSLTRTDSLLGTPRYMSPEQARPGPTDGRTDVYSLGATLYEMLTLRPPFDGRSAAELIQQISDRNPVHAREYDSRIPRDLETIVLKALAKRPSDRYADANELADDLTRYLSLEPVTARRIGPVGRAWRLALRHPVATGALTTAAVVIMTVATLAYVRIAQERDFAREAANRARLAERASTAANQKTEEAMRRQLLSSAALVRMSNVPNRRERGLGLLAQAANLRPGDALRTELRDEAAQLLSRRDVEARPPIPTGAGVGLAFGTARNRLATLADDAGELRFWDVAKREPQGQVLTFNGYDAEAGRDARRDDNPQGRRLLSLGRRIASAGTFLAVVWQNGNGIHLIDSSTGARAFDIPTPQYEIGFIHAASSAYGPRVVTVDREVDQGPRAPEEKRFRLPRPYRVNLWDTAHPDGPIATLTTKPSERTTGPPWPFWPLVSISPDGETVATLTSRDGIVSLWAAKDGTSLGQIETNTIVTAIALGPDNVLAVAGEGAIRLWQLDSKTPLPIITPTQPMVTIMRFSPDGSLLAVAGGFGEGAGRDVELWDPASDTLVAALPTAEFVSDVAFSADGRTLVAGQPKSVAVWAILEPVSRVHLSGFSAPVTSLAFGPGGVLGLTSGFDGALRFWDCARCPTTAHARSDMSVNTLASDGENWFVTSGMALRELEGSDPSSVLRTIRLPEPRNTRGGFRRPAIQMVSRNAKGRAIALVQGHDVLVWNPASPDEIRTIFPPRHQDRSHPRAPVKSAAVSPRGDRVYIFRHSYEIEVWKLVSGDAQVLDWDIPAQCTSMALSPDGKTLALGQSTGKVLLVDTNRGAVREELPADESKDSQATALLFSPDSGALAIGMKQGFVRLWQMNGEKRQATPLVRLPGHRGAVISLAFEPDGQRLASAGDDKTVDVWDLVALRSELKKLKLGW